MAQKSYDQKLRKRWARRQAKNDAHRKSKLADFNQMTAGRYWANAAISTIFGRGVKQMETKEPQSELEYIFDYKEYSVFQDMENGYYIAFNQNDETVCNEATIKMVTDNIDNILAKE